MIESVGQPLIAIIPAAGVGVRFGSELPKQYLELQGQTVLQRSIDAMLAVSRVSEIVVVVAADDTHFNSLPAASNKRVRRVQGGRSRAQSVAAGVASVRAMQGDAAWVLVHDAARPLVALTDVDRLVDRVLEGDGSGECRATCGGILAAPVTDTIKRADKEGVITETVVRADLWRAQTPQLFRAGMLSNALADALEKTSVVTSAEAPLADITDEASAMERAGHTCVLVNAVHPNPKITHPDDLAVATALLSLKRSETAHAHR